MMEDKEKAPLDDNSYMFKKLANLNPLTYDGAPNPKAFEDWIRGMKKLFDSQQCPEKWRVEFAGFCLMDEADLLWVTVRNQQDEPRFGWSEFKKLLRNRFYPVSL